MKPKTVRGERSRGCHVLPGSAKVDLKTGNQLQARIMNMPIAEHKGDSMKRFTFDFGVYEFHQHYILAHQSEEIHAGKHKFGALSGIVSDHYRTPFGLIANRVNNSAKILKYTKNAIICAALGGCDSVIPATSNYKIKN